MPRFVSVRGGEYCFIPGSRALRWARGSWLIRRMTSQHNQRRMQNMSTKAATGPETDQTVKKKIERLRELYADAPEIGRAALENIISQMKAGTGSGQKASSAGRIGLRQGKVSELITILKLVPGGAKRIRALSEVVADLSNADKVGTLHDMRYVLLDEDTLLFATAYDGEWDPYIDDFATFVPDDLDVVFSNCEGWPGIRNPAVKDFIVKH
jgi:hypothetical protein